MSMTLTPSVALMLQEIQAKIFSVTKYWVMHSKGLNFVNSLFATSSSLSLSDCVTPLLFLYSHHSHHYLQ